MVHLDTFTNPVRPAAETDREAVPARSASQRMDMEELSWMSVCDRPRPSILNFFVRWVRWVRWLFDGSPLPRDNHARDI